RKGHRQERRNSASINESAHLMRLKSGEAERGSRTAIDQIHPASSKLEAAAIAQKADGYRSSQLRAGSMRLVALPMGSCPAGAQSTAVLEESRGRILLRPENESRPRRDVRVRKEQFQAHSARQPPPVRFAEPPHIPGPPQASARESRRG